MKACRPYLIHAYFGINYQLIWSVVNTDLPLLKGQIQRLLSECGQEKQQVF